MFISSEELRKIITVVNELHCLRNEFYSEYEKSLDCFNFKKTKVRNVIDDKGELNTFYSDIMSIHKEICDNAHDIIVVKKKLGISQCRLKEPKSIHGKLMGYIGKVEKGAVSLNRCLNDLLGVRIICETLKSKDLYLLEEYLNDLFQDMKIRIRDSSNGSYVGLHIYFELTCKKILPWELQIWSLEDMVVNEASHEKNKKYYSNR